MRRTDILLPLLVLLLLGSSRTSRAELLELNVGIILEGTNPDQERAFKKGIEAANQKLSELRFGQTSQIALRPILKSIETGNAYAGASAACELIEEQVVAIIGPDSEDASSQVRWICQQHSIPYMLAQWDLNTDDSLLNYTVNLHPHYQTVGEALVSFLQEAEEWLQLGLIYSHDDSLVKYEHLLSKFKGRLVLRKWDTSDLTHKYVIKYFMTTRSQNRFVVDIPRTENENFLQLISEYNMTDQYYSYIFTDWDTQFIDPKTFSVDRGANFSALSILPILDFNYKMPDDAFSDNSASMFPAEEEAAGIISARDSLTYYFLIYDTLTLLSIGISRLASMTTIKPPTGLSCHTEGGWIHGPQLLNAIKSVKGDDMIGWTGRVEFDQDGRRKNVNITILEMSKEGFINYGYWNEKDNLVVTKEFKTTQAEIQKELKGQTLRVTTIEETPFVMYKGPPSEVKSSDPRDWHGFCIDLLNECAAALEFNYTVHPVTDGNYGTATIINGQEVWDGIIGELQFRKADLAVAMLTINYERERIIDFTTPFMNLGVSIIFKKPEDKQPDLFSFLRPLSPVVWGYVLIAYVGVSMALFFVARFSPYEWHNPHPCNTDSEQLENNFNMLNSLWFTIGSLMQQGSDILPRATSTRIIAGFWWFFTLIIISSYTANLAAFLTVERMQVPIEDVNDLAKQTKIKYGTRGGGSSVEFFSKSNQSVYQRMWQFMSSQKGVMINNATEAIARVKRGGYAYILESTMNEYFTQRDCDLIQIGNNLDSKGYGVGFPQGEVFSDWLRTRLGSKYRDAFSEVILQLQASQTLEQIRLYWWRNYSVSTPCADASTKGKDASSLGLEQVGGCFVMILIGLGASILISLQEFLYKALQRSKVTKRSFSEEVAREFRFSMARSSTRDFGAESALTLPPPPSKCILSSKECRMAALAYAPCLPAAARSPSLDNGRRRREARTSVLDVVRMHRRASSYRRHSHTPSNEHSQMPANRRAEVGQPRPSDSTRALLSQESLAQPEPVHLTIEPISSRTTFASPPTQSSQPPASPAPPPIPSGYLPYPPAVPLAQLPALPRPPQAYVSSPPPLPPPIGFASARMSSRETDDSMPYPTFVGSHGDIKLKKFTC